jgi:hypothetical protein
MRQVSLVGSTRRCGRAGGVRWSRVGRGVAAGDLRHLRCGARRRPGPRKYCGTAGVGGGATHCGSRSKGLAVARTLLVAMRG